MLCLVICKILKCIICIFSNIYFIFLSLAWIEKRFSGVFWAPQRLKPGKAFLNTFLTAFEHSSTGCEAPWAPSRQVNLPRNKFKEEKKNLCKRVNVNVCSRSSDPWRCVKTRARTKLMTTPSTRPTPWREKNKTCLLLRAALLTVLMTVLGYWWNHEGEESKQHVVCWEWVLCLGKK